MKNFINFLLFTFICNCTFTESIKNFQAMNNVEENIFIEFNLDDIEFENKSGYTKIITDSKSETATIGMPKLPSFSTMIMLDPQKKYDFTFDITSSYIVDDIDIVPNQEINNKGLEKEDIISINTSFYSSNIKYPEDNIVLSDPVIMRDMVLSYISVVPFSYNPELRQLEIYKNIEIQIVEVGNVEDPRRRDMPKSRVFENIYKNDIINYEVSTRDEDYQQEAILYIGSSSVINNSTFQQLFEWRRQRGFVVYTATTSQTGSSTSSIKNYINNAYVDFDPPPEYIALIGDAGGTYNIPTYYEDYGHDSYGSQCEGDHPYSQLDGNDLLPEVILGRMSIRASSEITTVVYKILNYEKATYLDDYIGYYEKAAMAGDPSSSGNSCAITKETIKESLEYHGFADVDIKTSGSGWATWMQNELSDGVLFFNYRGYLGMSGFSTSHIDNANSGWKLPFATVLTCGTGSFAEDQTSMSEKFFRAGTVSNPKGGVAAIGTATWNTHTLFNNIVDMGIYDGLLADDVVTAGAALVSGKFALYTTYPGDPYEWISAFTHWNNLMGDPATHLWTDTPEVLNAEHINSISFGTNFLDVMVESRGMPVEDAMVSLLINGGTIATNLFTDSNGMVTFNLDPNLSADLTLTITKQDFKPYQDVISIENSNVNVNYDNNLGVIVLDGNDGIASSGEMLDLSIPLINYGSSSSGNITATLITSSDNVIIENSTVSYGVIGSNESTYGEGFSISILPTAVQYENLDLRLEITDVLNGTWETIINLDLMGSLISITSSQSINPGQSSNFNIELTNSGSLLATNVVGELSSTDNQVEIIDANGTWGTLNAGESENSSNGFNVSINNDVLAGSQISLNLRIQSEEGYDRTELFTITAGNVSEEDPLGPDTYGYYIYDSGDTNYDFAPNYDWIEISSIGTDLNLSNSGNGNWSGNGPIAHINLPFNFKFFGVTYDEITVCTNGWVAMGDSDAESFRNYPIPGAGGPPGMIAAFWDDLETGNNGNVYVYSTNEYVIIQWDEMRTNWGDDFNTFQVILYNETALPSFDNNIKIQYQNFNNTSSGSFSSYPPIHGSYATIGIENHLSNDGLQYTYYNQYPEAAMTLSDYTALFITTQAPITLATPEISYDINESQFELETNQTTSSTLTITNTGEESSILSYNISTSYDIESPFDVVGGGPDAYGYYWSDSDISGDLNYEWQELEPSNSIQVEFSGNDSGTETIPIGFNFPFYGENYSQFIINANGWIGFGEDSDAWYNGNIPSLDAPMSAIFGFWDDLNPINQNCNSVCSGNVYYDSTAERLIVWYDNVAHWASGGFESSYYDFQIIIYPSGEVDINIRSIEGAYSATVGMQNQTGTTAIQVDVYNGDYFNDETSFKFKRPFIPTEWLSVSSSNGLSGELEVGQADLFNIDINSSDLIIGDYLANILISTNFNTLEIPIYLSVVDSTGLLGDLNGDTAINVSDIVILVSIILSQSDYVINGDLNQDGVLDVIDIVQLVSLILN